MIPFFQNIIRPFRAPEPAERFEAWLRGTHGQLVRYARLVADDDYEAVLSDALAGVMQAFYAGRVAEDALLPYMLRAIRNEAIKANRQDMRRVAREQQYEQAATCEHVALGAVMADERALLEVALRQLPDELSLILRLVFWEGLSFAEIARRQGMPKSTVRYRYERALEQLKKRLPTPFDHHE